MAHTQTFRLDEPLTKVRVRLQLQGDLELVWLGPLLKAAQAESQGNEGQEREPVVGVIPFTVTLRRTGACHVDKSTRTL